MSAPLDQTVHLGVVTPPKRNAAWPRVSGLHADFSQLPASVSCREVRPVSWTALTASSCVHPCGRSPLR